jgi:DNA-directed RNA polymerase subunit alpha
MDVERNVPEITTLVHTDRYGKFAVEPMERGFATTVGNALRRVLLSSVEGAAITSVQIRGVLHEFSTIPGVKEDATELILNLKELAIKVRRDGGISLPITLTVSCTGPGEVTGADVKTPEGVEVVNPEAHLATLDDDSATLEMELTVEVGKGFVLPETQERYKHVIGTIPVGAAFTPVRKVNFTAEPTRRGGRIDLERLVMEIWTNATVEPRIALSEAARILIDDYLKLFLPLGAMPEDETEAYFIGKNGQETPGSKRIDEFGFTNRTQNCLKKAGILTLKDLMAKTEDDLLGIRNFGRKSLMEIRAKLEEVGLELERSKSVPTALDTEAEEEEEEEPEEEQASALSEGEG